MAMAEKSTASSQDPIAIDRHCLATRFFSPGRNPGPFLGGRSAFMLWHHRMLTARASRITIYAGFTAVDYGLVPTSPK